MNQRLALLALAAAAVALRLLEKRGEYTYDEVEQKRWILGPGGRSGNCEDCIENADAGWIDMDDVFPASSQYGEVDEPPLHDHCECEVEFKTRRKRVYV